MDNSQVIEFANSNLGPTEQVNKNLYRGHMRIADKPAGTYFIDFNDEINVENFHEYQETLLSNEYYNLEDHEQWNFYLFLLRDKIDNTFKVEVEKNNRYARKYVFNATEFEDFFTASHSGATVQNTLIEDWKKNLANAGLADLIGEIKAKDILINLDNGSKNVTTKIITRRTDEDIQKIKFIRRIKLNDSYRAYPANRLFDFKKVNLFKGINGSGKTSLFEAIEIAICGMAFRNEKFKEKDGCIEVMFNYSKEPEICKPSELEKYKIRDLKWYNSKPSKFNEMHFSFNRFNYFNADAAQRFSSSSSDDEIKKALFNIILGPEYDHILDRTEKLIEEVRPAYNKLEAEKNTWEKARNVATQYIANWKENESMKKLVENLNSQIAALNPKIPLPQITLETIPIEQFLNEIMLILSELQKYDIKNSSVISTNDLLLSQKLEKLKLFNENLLEIQEKIKKIQERTKFLQHLKEILNQANKYFSDENLFRVEGMRQRMLEAEAGLNKISSLAEGIKGIFLEKYNIPDTLSDKMSSVDFSRNNGKKELQILEEDLRVGLNKLSNMQKMIQEIKLIGHAYIQSDESIHTCPLCETDFQRHELLKRIMNESTSEINDNSFLEEKNNRIQLLKKTIEINDHEAEELLRIKNAGELLRLEAITEETALSIYVERILNELRQLIIWEEKFQREKSLIELVRRSHISEEDYANLKFQLSEAFPDEAFVFYNHAFFSTQEFLITEELNMLRTSLEAQHDLRAQAAVSVKTDLNLPLNETFTISVLEQQFSALKEENKLLGNLATKLQSLIETEGLDFNEISIIVSRIRNDLETYKSSLTMELQLHEMQMQLKESNDYLKKNEGRFNRYRLAYQTLSKILDNSANEQVNLFFEKYLDEIIDVFKSIHAPREFKNVTIDKKGILTLTSLKNDKHSITQISTGQRSALAISIFLTLNRSLKNGPEIILFDDPIAFIDDLNALSFLDYLRFFVLKENKQIFFATANIKLASLFEKKFKFLEKDFEKWELTRPN